MKNRKIICILFILLSLAGRLFADDSIGLLEDNLSVIGHASNSDNSLVLLNTCTNNDWQSRIYAFNPGDCRSWSFNCIWAKSTSPGCIRDLIYSPYSNDFYFLVAYASEDEKDLSQLGLHQILSSETTVTWDLQEQIHPMTHGMGRMLVNKTGVWFLKDIPDWNKEYPWVYSRLYQIENEKGEFLLNIPVQAKEIYATSFDWLENGPDNPNKINDEYLRETFFKTTDYTLVFLDNDHTTWWNFNCVLHEGKTFSSFEEALEAGKNIDIKYNSKRDKKEHKFTLIIIFIFIGFSLIILFITLFSITKLLAKKNYQNSLKELNKLTFDIQEKERAKISRDIHDSVVQDIRVIRLETENLNVKDESKEKQAKIEDIATDCIIKLRNICYNLTPAELTINNQNGSSEIELISIINSLVQQFSSRTHFPCVFKVEEDFEYPVLEKETTQNIFRVIQEALTNIEKHSYATKASIFIKEENNVLQIYITDDGIGCNPDELQKKLKRKEHLGLRSMIDRMELIGGSIEFFTAQDDGMEVKISLPLVSKQKKTESN